MNNKQAAQEPEGSKELPTKETLQKFEVTLDAHELMSYYLNAFGGNKEEFAHFLKSKINLGWSVEKK